VSSTSPFPGDHAPVISTPTPTRRDGAAVAALVAAVAVACASLYRPSFRRPTPDPTTSDTRSPTSRYRRPPWAARVIGGRLARLFRPSVVVRLSVPGRTSGTDRSVPVVVLGHEGERYLVSVYGWTEWSRNLRAGGRGTLTHGRRGHESFRAVEVPVEQRPPLIAAYLDAFGRYPNVRQLFQDLPDPADHPVFLLTTKD
jgi:hypothetical protein